MHFKISAFWSMLLFTSLYFTEFRFLSIITWSIRLCFLIIYPKFFITSHSSLEILYYKVIYCGSISSISLKTLINSVLFVVNFCIDLFNTNKSWLSYLLLNIYFFYNFCVKEFISLYKSTLFPNVKGDNVVSFSAMIFVF